MSLRFVGCMGLGVLITVFIISGILMLRMNGIGAMIEQPIATPGQELPTDTVKITYLVTGSVTNAEVTYQDANNATKDEHVRLPWQQSFTMGGGAYAHVTARTDDSTASLTCEILANSAKWRDERGNGEASCGGFTGTQ